MLWVFSGYWATVPYRLVRLLKQLTGGTLLTVAAGLVRSIRHLGMYSRTALPDSTLLARCAVLLYRCQGSSSRCSRDLLDWYTNIELLEIEAH
jgi:hypothetical protein